MAIDEAKKLLASQYFIENQMSVAQISKRLTISEKTLFNWKKEGNWDDKRTRYLKSQYSTNQTLYELLHLVAEKAVDDFKQEGIMPDQKTLYFIMNMAGKLKDLKAFEQQTAEEKEQEFNQLNNEQQENKNADKEILKQEALQNMMKALLEG